MIALNWIFALTLALVSCLSAQPVRRGNNDLLFHILKFNKTIEGVACAKDARLYSPLEVNSDCILSALNCTIGELEVLKAECNITKRDDYDYDDDDDDDDDDKDEDLFTENLINLISELTEYPKMNNLTIPTTPNPICICEKTEEIDLEKFLENLKVQVQLLNAVTTDRP